jgi:cyclohexanone monooxygenase
MHNCTVLGGPAYCIYETGCRPTCYQKFQSIPRSVASKLYLWSYSILTHVLPFVSFNMPSVDAIVIGAGFGGLYNLIKLKELGLSVRAFDKAPEIGGTWYWSQYPGATSDSASEIYRYRFNKDLLQTDEWPDHYVSQRGSQQYLKNIAKLYNLEQDIQLSTKLASAAFDPTSATWTATFENGEVWTSTYLIMAIGCFHTPNYPKITGLEKFNGPVYHTALVP